MTTVSTPDRELFRDAVGDAVRFCYRYVLELVVVSVLWFLASLPLVTAGPATLGAYRVVLDLRETGTVETRAVIACVRRGFLHALLLGSIPVVFWAVALLYAIQYVGTRSPLSLGLLVVTFYAGTYVAMVNVPTFVAMARDEHAFEALRFGRSWVGDHPTLALVTGLLTGVLAVGCLALTVAFPALFGGLAAALHVQVVADDSLSGAPGPAIEERSS